ncbi:MAG TPA: DUF3011 domain-containing protein [Thermoanaerobaculia bacterium]|nr:DUF3011 domain-containing protein [Thermoanaerobaculia bacterium]
MNDKTLLVATLFATLLLAALPARPDEMQTVTCESKDGERQHCPADTSSGVVLVRVTGSAACLLGKSWGYDDQGIWVADGCGGEFAVGARTPAAVPPSSPVPAPTLAPVARTPTEALETWGTYDPGKGFLVGRSELGELAVSGYVLLRYMNQNDEDGVFTDHLGNERVVDTRHDIMSHRVIAWLMGWLGDPRLRYAITLWTVNATDQDAIFGNIGYQFSKRFSLYGGVNGNPGSRSLQGSHPYWLGHDRVMADEFFRPFFTVGVWANGELAPGLWYLAQVGNSSSILGITAAQFDRKLQTVGLSMWWMPTTHEFGPRGGYGDWEYHEELATRFGFSATQSPEERFPDPDTGKADNTTIRLADSLNVFDTGALAPGVTVSEVDYAILAIDAGMKYKGIFLQAEYYKRQLEGFKADGPLPVRDIEDDGFYVQASFFPIKKKLELYAVTSQIYGDEDAGFDDSSEYVAGMNFYPYDTRNHRLNLQVMDVNNSPVSSSFGYYMGGQEGFTASTAFSVFF